MNVHRLEGLTTTALDRYLIALGFLSVLERTTLAGLRSAWSPDDTLVLHAEASLDEVVSAVAGVARDAPERAFSPVATPWRGKAADGRPFAELRNAAPDEALAWFDAVYVPARDKDAWVTRGNPLLGQGGAFGRSEVAEGAVAARERLAATFAGRQASGALEGLVGLVTGTSVTPKVARALGVNKKVLGAYSSGRGTAPGGSSSDVDASAQNPRAGAWEILLAIEGLLWFRGTRVRGGGQGGPTRGGFPMLVSASAAGLDAATREQDGYEARDEVLAPLWSVPTRTPVAQRALRSGRLRVDGPRGRSVVTSALEATIATAGHRATGVGFDRYVRFAFVVPSDPRYRFAVRRGQIGTGAVATADVLARSVLPYLRAQARLAPAQDHRSAPHRRAVRNLEEAAARGSREPAPAAQRAAQREVVAALLTHERVASRVHPDEVSPGSGRACVAHLRPSRFPWWWGGGWSPATSRLPPGDSDAAWVVARAIASANRGLADELLCTADVRGYLELRAGRSPADLERASSPVAEVVNAAAAVARRSAPEASSSEKSKTPVGDSGSPEDQAARSQRPVSSPVPAMSLAFAQSALVGRGRARPEDVARFVPAALRVEIGNARPEAGPTPNGLPSSEVGSTVARLLDGADSTIDRADLAGAILVGDYGRAVRIAATTAYRRAAADSGGADTARAVPLNADAERVLAGVDSDALALAVLLGGTSPAERQNSQTAPDPAAEPQAPKDQDDA